MFRRAYMYQLESEYRNSDSFIGLTVAMSNAERKRKTLMPTERSFFRFIAVRFAFRLRKRDCRQARITRLLTECRAILRAKRRA